MRLGDNWCEFFHLAGRAACIEKRSILRAHLCRRKHGRVAPDFDIAFAGLRSRREQKIRDDLGCFFGFAVKRDRQEMCIANGATIELIAGHASGKPARGDFVCGFVRVKRQRQ